MQEERPDSETVEMRLRLLDRMRSTNDNDRDVLFEARRARQHGTPHTALAWYRLLCRASTVVRNEAMLEAIELCENDEDKKEWLELYDNNQVENHCKNSTQYKSDLSTALSQIISAQIAQSIK